MAKHDTLHSLDHHLGWQTGVPVMVLMLALPWLTQWMGDTFYLTLASRVLIFAMAATSLNFILGFGGMVSFGHAALVGAGAYTVAVLTQAGITDAWVLWPAAMLVSALLAALIGAVSLRTQGVYFIMITLAFAQMLYYLIVSLKTYGGDDGLALAARSQMGWGLDLANEQTFYAVTCVCTVVVMVGLARVLNSRFGHVLQGIRDNESRMQALGYAVYRYKWVAFVMAGALAGLAGALLANLGGFVSPSIMQWSQSGMLLMMVILGGVGHLWGGVWGAVVFLLLEEVLSSFTIHWQLGLGALLLAVVLLAPKGLAALWQRARGGV